MIAVVDRRDAWREIEISDDARRTLYWFNRETNIDFNVRAGKTGGITVPIF
jgi:hypothetical protein